MGRDYATDETRIDQEQGFAMTRPSHAALVEEVAKAIIDELTDRKGLRQAFDNIDGEILAEIKTAIGEIACSVVAARLSDVTPEMVEAVAKAIFNHARGKMDALKFADERADVQEFVRDHARAAISAFLAASPLTPGEKGEG